MKLSVARVVVAGIVLSGSSACVFAQESTPAQQRIAAANKQLAAHTKSAESYNNLAVALIHRARETESNDFYKQAQDAIAQGFLVTPHDYQLRKTQVDLWLDEHAFVSARDEAKDLNQHNPDDASVYGLMARADIGLGDLPAAIEAAQWTLNLQANNVPGLLVAAELRNRSADPEGALDLLNRAYAETSPTETGELASIANRIASIDIDMGKPAAAKQVLQNASEVFPGFPETLRNQARLAASSSSNAQQVPTEAKLASIEGPPLSHVDQKSAEQKSAAVPMPAHTMPVVFSPVPAALFIPKATATERIIKTAQGRVGRNPNDPAAYTALGAAFFQRARETGDVEDFQLAEQALNKSLNLVSADFSSEAALATMAEVCMGEHRFSDAVDYAQQALALGSGRHVFVCHRG